MTNKVKQENEGVELYQIVDIFSCEACAHKALVLAVEESSDASEKTQVT